MQGNTDRNLTAVQRADNEISRMKRIMKEIDKFEEDIETTKRIRDAVRVLRTRVDVADTRLNRTQPSAQARSGHPPTVGSGRRR